MTYSGTMIRNLEEAVERAQENARLTHLHFENNSALRQYLYDLALRIVEKASEPVPPYLALPDFLKQSAMKLGMVEAAQMIREEAAEMRRMEETERSMQAAAGR
jgi:hypothetical protein